MVDERIRELRRRWQGSRDPNDYARFLRERLRAGNSPLLGIIEELAEPVSDAVREKIASGSAYHAYSQLVPEANGFLVENDVQENVWRFYGVPFGGELWVAELMKEPIRDDSFLLEIFLEEMRSSHMLPSAPWLYALISTAYRQRNHPVGSQRICIEEFREHMGVKSLLTSTACVYHGRAPDEVIHGYGFAVQEKPTALDLVSDKYGLYVSSDCGLERELEAILGTSNFTELESVFGWFSKARGTRVLGTDRRHESWSSSPSAQGVVMGRGIGKDFNIYVTEYTAPAHAFGWYAQKIENFRF